MPNPFEDLTDYSTYDDDIRALAAKFNGYIICPDCKGQSLTVEQAAESFRNTGDTSCVCATCNNKHVIPAAQTEMQSLDREVKEAVDDEACLEPSADDKNLGPR